MVYFFWAGVIFSTENAKAWSFLANFDLLAIMSEIYVLIGVLFTGLNNVAVYQNVQMWDMVAPFLSTVVYYSAL